jgi:protein SCO1/2
MARSCWSALTTLLLSIEAIGVTEPGQQQSPRTIAGAEGCQHCATAPALKIAPQAGVPLSTDWLEIKARPQIDLKHIDFTDQNGAKGQLDQLIDRPTLITFFYTRCQNSSKCTAVISHLASLTKLLEAHDLQDSCRIVGITYEPQHDEPQRLKRYGVDRGIEFNDAVRFLQLSSSDQSNVLERLQSPVNYNSGWVTSHGVELVFLDSKSRLVRKYHTLIWSNERIVDDLNKVLAETN